MFVSGPLLCALVDFMLSSLSRLLDDLSLSAKAEPGGNEGVRGVVAPESTDGDGLPVDILSRSLSDSSLIELVV